MRRLLLLAVLFALAIGVPLAPAFRAEEFDPAVLDQMAKDVHQVPLTEDMIDRFVASYPEMKEVVAKFPATQMPDEPSDKSDLEMLPPDKRAARITALGRRLIMLDTGNRSSTRIQPRRGNAHQFAFHRPCWRRSFYRDTVGCCLHTASFPGRLSLRLPSDSWDRNVK